MFPAKTIMSFHANPFFYYAYTLSDFPSYQTSLNIKKIIPTEKSKTMTKKQQQRMRMNDSVNNCAAFSSCGLFCSCVNHKHACKLFSVCSVSVDGRKRGTRPLTPLLLRHPHLSPPPLHLDLYPPRHPHPPLFFSLSFSPP